MALSEHPDIEIRGKVLNLNVFQLYILHSKSKNHLHIMYHTFCSISHTFIEIINLWHILWMQEKGGIIVNFTSIHEPVKIILQKVW